MTSVTKNEAKRRAAMVVNNGSKKVVEKTIGQCKTLHGLSEIMLCIALSLVVSLLLLHEPVTAIEAAVGLCVGWAVFIGAPWLLYKFAIKGLHILACMVVRNSKGAVSYDFNTFDWICVACALCVLGKNRAVSIKKHTLVIDEDRLWQLEREADDLGIIIFCPKLPNKYLEKIHVYKEPERNCEHAFYDVDSWTGPITYSVLPDVIRVVMEGDDAPLQEAEHILSVYLPMILDANKEAISTHDDSLYKEVVDVANGLAHTLQGIADENKQNRILDAHCTLSAVTESMKMNGY